MKKLSDTLYNWASDIDQVTLDQAHLTSKLPIIAGHLALMPDAHLGQGATIGSVIPTRDAIIPSAVGVDIGCGMIAVETTLRAEDLPEDLSPLVGVIERAVPAGLGVWHDDASRAAAKWFHDNPNEHLDAKQEKKVVLQFGTLGSGNHFFEVCLDERDMVWVVMHSGSRGVGNQLANVHIDIAEAIAKEYMPKEFVQSDPKGAKELSWLQENTPEFDAYIHDMRWSQDYAMANRKQMMDAALSAMGHWFFENTKLTQILHVKWVNCHHNFAQKERHGGEDVWVTRKGAIKADIGDEGVIPGSMGGKSYIVKGLGNTESYTSCSHGAGRKMSRTKAKKTFSLESFHEVMGTSAWQKGMAKELLDEHPGSYKDIDQVMADQKDLVEIVHELHAIVNYKGTK